MNRSGADLVLLVSDGNDETADVPVAALHPADSPRLAGVDKAYVERLAEIETPLPPILVDRRTMRVVDGMHRLLAALTRGQETIEVEYFDGSPEDAFLRSVELNVRHGLPLSQADRRAAAARIIDSHPQLSDRAVGYSVGLAARAVAAIRRRKPEPEAQPDARIGRDGRVRPLNSAQGRARAAAILLEHPEASLREVARRAGISPTTVRDVRNRLALGEEPVPQHVSAADRAADELSRKLATPLQLDRAALEKLLRDPSLRYNDNGRELLHLLQVNAAAVHDVSNVAAAVPPHCAPSVVQLALQYGRMWFGLAQELDKRAQLAQSAADS